MGQTDNRADFLRFRESGSPAALARVFDRVAPELLLAATQLAPAGVDSEDLVQATFLAAIESAQRWDPTRPLVPWLIGILVNCSRAERRRISRREPGTGPAPTAPSADDPAAAAEAREQSEAIARALDALPAHYRSVLMLHLVYGLEPRQIARSLGCPVPTVKTRLQRGREILKRALPAELAGAALGLLLPGRGLAATRRTVLAAAKSYLPAAKAAGMAGVFVMKKTLVLVGAVLVLGAGFWAATKAIAVDATRDATKLPGEVAGGNARSPSSHATVQEASRVQATAPTQVAPAGLRLEVVAADGKPRRGAKVFRWSRRGAFEHKMTDSEGRAEFEPSDDAGGFVVVSPPLAPASLELESLAGDHRIVVGGDAAVTGWVTVDGAAPAKALVLTLGSVLWLPASLAWEVRDEIRDASELKLSTGPDGSFRFRGLPAGWSGYLRWGWKHWLAEPSKGLDIDVPSIPLAAPRRDLHLALTALPLVTGRVVWADTRTGVERPLVSVRVRFADGEESPYRGATSEEDGRFVVPLVPQSMRATWRDPAQRVEAAEIWVDVLTHEGPRRRFTIRAKDMRAPGDVGDLVLPRGQRRWFVVTDSGGTPLAGALVEAEALSAPTDEHGRTSVLVMDPSRRFAIGALGYHTKEVTDRGSGTRADPFVVSLERSGRILVRIRDASGNTIRGVTLRITSQQPPFERSKRWWPSKLAHKLSRMRFISGMTPGGTGKGHFDCRPTDEGEVELNGLRAGVELELAVLDRRGQALVKRRFVVPREPQDMTIELRVSHVAIHLGGRVVDEAAQPVVHAEVRLVSESCTTYGYTDKGGTFRFDPLSATDETVHLLVRARGFAPLRSLPLRLSADIQPVELRLAKGHDVTVAVVDSDGERVPGTRVRVDDQRSESSHGRRLEPGLWRFEDLALAEVTFWTTIGGRRFDCRQSTALGEARIVVPIVGTLEVTAPRALLPDAGTLSARLLSSTGKELTSWELLGKGKTLASGKRPLLPGDYAVELLLPYSRKVVGARRKVRITAHGTTQCRFGD